MAEGYEPKPLDATVGWYQFDLPNSVTINGNSFAYLFEYYDLKSKLNISRNILGVVPLWTNSGCCAYTDVYFNNGGASVSVKAWNLLSTPVTVSQLRVLVITD